jgi:hypothetical protein
MATRLSNSQLNKFQTCGKAYEYSYKQRIRTKSLKSSLLFGSAFDAATSILFVEKNLDAAKTAFIENWKSSKECPDIRNAPVEYFKSDIDLDLIPEFKNEETNIQGWESLKVKGLVMLDSLNKDILPILGKVHSTQEKVSMFNDEGDEIMGYADLVAEINGTNAILDVKTASSLYDENAVKFSQQLTLYTHILEPKYNTRLAGYLVVGKKILKHYNKVCKTCGFKPEGLSKFKTCNNEINGKRCNGEWNETPNFCAPTQILVEEISKQTEKIVLENLDAINTAIKHNIFTRNLSACQNIYGSPCEYIGLCWNNSMENLEIKVDNK